MNPKEQEQDAMIALIQPKTQPEKEHPFVLGNTFLIPKTKSDEIIRIKHENPNTSSITWTEELQYNNKKEYYYNKYDRYKNEKINEQFINIIKKNKYYN